MVKAFWDRLFPKPPLIQQFEQKIAELNHRADQLRATLDGETEWFLRCERGGEGKITCESVGPKDESS